MIKSSTIPPSLFGKQEYCAFPSTNFEASLEATFWIKAKAFSPFKKNSPI